MSFILKQHSVACADCNMCTGGGSQEYPEKCACCDSTRVVPLPLAPNPRTFTLRMCPICGAIKVEEDTLYISRPFTDCTGPHMGPFPTDRSHKFTLTEAVRVEEIDPPDPRSAACSEQCHVHPDRQAVALVEDTREPLCGECYYEHVASGNEVAT